MKPDGGGPASPQTITHDTGGSRIFPQDFGLSGLSLRDWFAGQALAQCGDWGNREEAARHCWAVADAMLKARE